MKTFSIISGILNVILILLLLGVYFHPQPPVKIHVTDTITVTKEVIKEKTKLVNTFVVDTFYVNNRDTIFLENLPIEYKSYKDTIKTDTTNLTLKIDYHGAFAEIDTVGINYNFSKEVKCPKIKRWGWDIVIGPSIGYGYCIGSNNNAHGPFFGVTATLGFGYRMK